MNFKKYELLFLLTFIVLFICIRSIHFAERLNFSTDQAVFSSKVLDIFENKKLTLIGPRFSLEYQGRYLFQGPLIYYFLSLFLLIGNFDPVRSSYAFMLFCALMIIPLYFGTKNLINKKAAVAFVCMYSLLPFFIDYTKFLWNPTFQLSLLPVLVYLMGNFKKRNGLFNFFLISFAAGLILEFHYLFLVTILGIFIYYFVIKRLKVIYLGVFLLGLITGNLPILIFEIRNNFYNIRTLLYIFGNLNDVLHSRGQGGGLYPHYFLSITFFAILIGLSFVRKYINKQILISLFIGLMFLAFWTNLLFPKPIYGTPFNWSYGDEVKAHKIIRNTSVSSFAITNLIYDPQAEVQKYLFKVEGDNNNLGDYPNSPNLFVLSTKKDITSDPAYEVKSLQPVKIINVWQINQDYYVYLLKRMQ